MDHLQIANSSLMWILCSVVIIAVIVQTAVFIRRGWQEATMLGVSGTTLKKAVGGSIMLSILPTIPILLVLFMMMPLLGTPFPWLRVSIIGSAPIEFLEATMGVQAMGEELTGGTISNRAFGAAIWCMTMGGTASALVTTLILKPVSMTYDRFSKGSVKLLIQIGACCLAGVLCSIFVSNCTNIAKSVTPLIVGLFSYGFSMVVCWLAKKNPAVKKIADYNLALSMVVGMIVGVVVS